MSKARKRTELSTLIGKYQRSSVVSEIEKNLLSSKRETIPVSSLSLGDFFNENNYSLSSYKSLETSLKENGFLVPLIVVRAEKNNRFEILNGIKRFLLAKEIGFTQIPCVIADLTGKKKIEYIVENIIQEHDSPLVMTYVYKVLKEKYFYSDSDIAQLAHISLFQVRNLIRLDLLPDYIKNSLICFELSYGEARTLLNLPEDKQKELYQRIKDEHLSVREIEKEKRLYLGKKKKSKIKVKGKKITITFRSEEEAQKEYERLKKNYSD